MKFIRLILVMSVLASGSIFAQTSANPWQISIGATMPSINMLIESMNGNKTIAPMLDSILKA